MKYNFQIEIMKFLNKVLKITNFNKNSLFSTKEFLSNGLLEWDEDANKFIKININKKIELDSLFFIDDQKNVLINNTKHFLKGGPGNNAILWGSRGTGKSSLILAIYFFFKYKYDFTMVEIKFFQIKYLPKILRALENNKKK